MTLLNKFKYQDIEQYTYDNWEEAEQKAVELSKESFLIISQVRHVNGNYGACNFHSSLAYPNVVVSIFRNGKQVEL
ncbi:MAG: hypothetical protein P4L35_08940 [Ignavibacteriaceae bacterium]|nr:hypothetical protein [Ignavibacteriaceae bacterium]